MAKKLGRDPLFTPEMRGEICRYLATGVTIREACATVGISVSTVFLWLQIGNAIVKNEYHARIPKDELIKQDYVQFVEEFEKARAQQRASAITQIVNTGSPTWIHKITGVISRTAPKAITWFNRETGKVTWIPPEDPTEKGWERQWSGEAWDYDPGQWQAKAWYLERIDPDTWARRDKHTVYVPKELIMLMQQLGVNPDDMLGALYTELEAQRDEIGLLGDGNDKD